MDTKVTIGENSFSLTSQQPTGNVRSGLVSTVATRIITAHQDNSPKTGAPVTRTTRKVEQTITASVGGVVVSLPVSASLTVSLPKALPAGSIDSVLNVLSAWMAQATFVDDIKNQSI